MGMHHLWTSNVLQILEKQLSSQGEQEYLATSSLTAADIMVGYVLFFIQKHQSEYVSLGEYPHVQKYTKLLLTRPAANAVFGKLNEVSNGKHSYHASSNPS